MTEVTLETCPLCGALPCDWTQNPLADAERHETACQTSLLAMAIGDITAALVMAGKEHLISEWTAPYVTAVNAADASTEPADALTEAREALKEAREALHFHYVEWDGEPEDAVPLQLARQKCDAALSRLNAGEVK